MAYGLTAEDGAAPDSSGCAAVAGELSGVRRHARGGPEVGYHPRMPTVARIGGFRFFFYSNEGSEAPHVHVQHERKIAKFWLEPVSLAASGRFSAVELRSIERIVGDNQGRFLEVWNEFFGR